jgi:UDP-N-acetylglucosamine 2-epimerase (non-hydrolysing)
VKKKICCIVGTRPEAVKMAPVIAALRRASWAEVDVVATCQHREMLEQALAAFEIGIDVDLDVMVENQTLAGLTARILTRLDPYLVDRKPDLVLAQGDTTTVLTAGIACFYRQVPFGHVEAGLRTFDMNYPFPEEFNRRATGLLATLHFAPTATARDNLRLERTPDEAIVVTGNTVIDALLDMRARQPALPFALPEDATVVLMTAHRRENFGPPLENVFAAVRELLDRFPRLHFVYPVHPNPKVSSRAREMLGGHPRVLLCEPLGYPQLVAVLNRCALVLTDSGGLQEEAPALGKPVLVLRRETERPEAVDLGVARLIGTDRTTVVDEVATLLTDPQAYSRMSRGGSPYGDGLAASRIVEAIARHFQRDQDPESLGTHP